MVLYHFLYCFIVVFLIFDVLCFFFLCLVCLCKLKESYDLDSGDEQSDGDSEDEVVSIISNIVDIESIFAKFLEEEQIEQDNIFMSKNGSRLRNRIMVLQ